MAKVDKQTSPIWYNSKQHQQLQIKKHVSNTVSGSLMKRYQAVPDDFSNSPFGIQISSGFAILVFFFCLWWKKRFKNEIGLIRTFKRPETLYNVGLW